MSLIKFRNNKNCIKIIKLNMNYNLMSLVVHFKYTLPQSLLKDRNKQVFTIFLNTHKSQYVFNQFGSYSNSPTIWLYENEDLVSGLECVKVLNWMNSG